MRSLRLQEGQSYPHISSDAVAPCRPLPEDLFSGLEDLALTSQPSSSAAAPARALNPLEAPLETAVPGSSSYPPDDPYAPVDPFSMSIKGPPVEAPPAAKAKASDSGGSGAHAGLEAAAAPTQRKKKVRLQGVGLSWSRQLVRDFHGHVQLSSCHLVIAPAPLYHAKPIVRSLTLS